MTDRELFLLQALDRQMIALPAVIAIGLVASLPILLPLYMGAR